jgi:hypothetical protein
MASSDGDTPLAVQGPTTTTEVEEICTSQQRLEEEDPLAKLPGEEDAASINPDILDTSMEDITATTGATPNPTKGGAAPQTNPNPTRGGDGLLSLNKINNHVSNPMGDTVTNSNKLNMYQAARNKYKTTVIPNLNAGGSYILTMTGSFLPDGDNRFHVVHMESDVCNGTNISYSFNPNTMQCGCCGSFKGRKLGDKPFIWVFSDQNFSPLWPTDGGVPCMKIIRMEDGNLLTCVSKFLCKYGYMIL